MKYKQAAAKITTTLNRNTGYLILLAIIIFGFAILGFQKSNKELLQDTNTAVTNTETIVAKQDETLQAIKQTAIDNKLLSDEKTNIIICMLQVPVAERTTDTVTNCRKQVETMPTTQNENTAQPTQTSNPQSQEVEQPQSPTPPQEEPVDEGLIPDRIPIIGGLL